MNTLELIIVIAIFAVCMSGVLLFISLVQDTYVKNEIAFDMFFKSELDQANIEDHVFERFSDATSTKSISITPCIQNVLFLYATGTYNVLNLDRLFFDKNRDNALGGDCLGYPNPPSSFQHVNSISVPDTTLTDVDIFEDKVLVAGRSNISTTKDLFLLSQGMDEQDSIDSGSGLNVVDVVGDYIFGGANQNTGQFQIFKIQNDSLSLIATSSLPTVSGSFPEAISIFYENNKVYIGTHRTAGREFHIFDVSDPTQPIWLGSREVNHNINDIVVRNGIAYLGTSGNIRDLIVLDVHDPTNITQITALDIDGNEDGRRLFLTGNVLYVGRFKSLLPTTKDLYAIKIDDQNPALLSIIFSKRYGGDINQIISIGDKVVVGSKKNDGEISIFSINNPNNDLFTFSIPNISAFDVENENLISVSENGKINKYKMQ